MTGSAWSGSKLCSLFVEHWKNCRQPKQKHWRLKLLEIPVLNERASGALSIQPLWAEEVSVLYVSVLYPIKLNGVDSMH